MRKAYGKKGKIAVAEAVVVKASPSDGTKPGDDSSLAQLSKKLTEMRDVIDKMKHMQSLMHNLSPPCNFYIGS